MKRSRYLVSLIFLTFFVISVLTNIFDAIMPDIIISFSTRAWRPRRFSRSASLLRTECCRFPPAFWVERFSEKPVMIAAFVAGGARFAQFCPLPHVSSGCLFFPLRHRFRHGHVASCHQSVAASCGGRGAFRVQLGVRPTDFRSGFVFDPAYLFVSRSQPGGFSSEYGTSCFGRLHQADPGDASLGFAVLDSLLTVLMIVVLHVCRFPRVEGGTSDEQAGSRQMYGELFRKPLVWLFFLCVFAYVGSEQGSATIGYGNSLRFITVSEFHTRDSRRDAVARFGDCSPPAVSSGWGC